MRIVFKGTEGEEGRYLQIQGLLQITDEIVIKLEEWRISRDVSLKRPVRSRNIEIPPPTHDEHGEERVYFR